MTPELKIPCPTKDPEGFTVKRGDRQIRQVNLSEPCERNRLIEFITKSGGVIGHAHGICTNCGRSVSVAKSDLLSP